MEGAKWNSRDQTSGFRDGRARSGGDLLNFPPRPDTMRVVLNLHHGLWLFGLVKALRLLWHDRCSRRLEGG